MINNEIIKIAEIPSKIWNFSEYRNFPIDRSEITVADFLKQHNVIWIFGDDPHADFRVYKEENFRNGLLSFRRLRNEVEKRFEKIPYMNLNGEAQENSKIAYFLADPERTFSVAPGKIFKRLYFPSLWSDPHLNRWGDRCDRICWIGRPLPDRIRLAKKINEMGIELDIYSREPWPLSNWKGSVANEFENSIKYKYRIVYENSVKNLYHSEKLFNSIRSGCVTFYIADPQLKTPIEGSFLRYNHKTLEDREGLAPNVIKRMKTVLYGDEWEQYSFKSFYERIILEALKSVNRS